MNRKQNSNGNGSRQPQGQGLPVQQIIQMGEQAASLLNSPVYLTAHQLVVNGLIEQLVGSEPKEREKRESLYLEIRAMGHAARQLSEMTARAKELLERQAQEQSSSHADYLDRQGFGLDENYQPEYGTAE